MTSIDTAIRRFGLRLKRQGRESVGPCPKCGGRDRFAVNVAKGVWHCRVCKSGGDGIDLVQHIEDCSFRQALAVLDSGPGDLGVDRPNLRRDVDRQRNAEHDNNLAAERIWKDSSPLGSQAIAYFEWRGIDINAVPKHGGLRWHSACPFDGDTKACIVARYTDAISSTTRGIWRRPITGEKPKALGPMAGCVIRLWPDDGVEGGLVLGEGVETVLAAATRITHRGTLLRPAWAAGSAGNMTNLPVLAGIEALTLLVDNDASGAGQKAAAACARRWQNAGREVTRLMIDKSGADFNDAVRA